MFPLNGCLACESRPSGMTRSSATPWLTSMLARVVSKWQLFGITIPGRVSTVENRRFSATRPWWTGRKAGKPKTSRIESWRWKKLRAPA